MILKAGIFELFLESFTDFPTVMPRPFKKKQYRDPTSYVTLGRW